VASFPNGVSTNPRRRRPRPPDALRAIAAAVALSATFGAVGSIAGGHLWLVIGVALGAIWSLGDSE
jgi:hypothetical protein